MPLTRRQIYRRRRIVVGGAAGIALGIAFYLPFTLLAPPPEVTMHEVAFDVAAAVQPVIHFPAYGASGLGALGYDGVLASGGAAGPLPIASISKVVTALVVLDAHPLAVGEAGPIATFTDIDEGFYNKQVANDGVVARVSAGETMSQRNMLDVALMASANNYAQSVAAWAFGSEAAYVEAARAWLGENGLTGTVITDATGIQPTNVSTVADLIEIAKLALANPVLAQIVSTPSAAIPTIGTVTNRNALLGVDGVDGIKTGTLDEAGSCLLFSADHVVAGRSITLVGVVLGGPDHATINAAIRGLLAQADAGFREITLVEAGEVFAQFDTPWGDDAAAIAAEPATIVAWAGAPIALDVDVADVGLTDDGADVGLLTFEYGEYSVSVPLELEGSLDDPGPWWRLTNPLELF